MKGLRAISIISILQIAFVTAGYLSTELCITVLYGRDQLPYPPVIDHAIRYWWVFMLLAIAWTIVALAAESKFQQKLYSTYLPCGIGVALLLFTFALYASALMVAAMGPGM